MDYEFDDRERLLASSQPFASTIPHAWTMDRVISPRSCASIENVYQTLSLVQTGRQAMSNSIELSELFRDILQEHVSMSKSKIVQLHDIPQIRQLVSTPTVTIATEGLRTLRAMLKGEKPTSLLDTYAVVHIAYTCLSLEAMSVMNCLKDMFVTVSQLGAGLKSNLERKTFDKIANAIWSVPVQADRVMGSQQYFDSGLHTLLGP